MINIVETQTEKYASCVDASKRVRWDIDRDIIRGRDFEMDYKLLPDSISGIQRFEFLDPREARLLSQIQGRTYANMFGLVERFINCKILELSQHHWTGDQVALEALVRFSDEELKHQELFRRIEHMIAAKMPPGYHFVPQPNEVANAVLSKSTWAVLGLTLMIELVAAVDGIVRAQAEADVDYFLKVSGAAFFEENIARLREETLSAYRWQYILSGAAESRFQRVLRSMITAGQFERIEKALAPIADSVTVRE